MKNLIKNNKSEVLDMLWISSFIFTIFVFTINFVHKTDYQNLGGWHSWLSGSTINFTNNWLKDGIIADKFTMLEKPYSIESQTIESRQPYVSYPSGTIMVTYGVAKITGKDQIGIRFIKILSIILYALDALLIGFFIYLILRYILKIENRNGKIFISILLSSLWILFPNNVHYLKNILFADQMILFFTCLLLFLEILRNYVGITKSLTKTIINTLLFLTILLGMLIDYYFWIQVFILCAINFIDSLRQKKSFTCSIKEVSIYIIPVILAVGLFFLQLIQINDSWITLKHIMLFRTGAGDLKRITQPYIVPILYASYGVFGIVGMAFFFVSTFGSLLLLLCLIFNKKIQQYLTKETCNFFKISLFIVLPAYLQILILSNHSAIHEFSLLKLNLLFVFGLLLFSYVIFILTKKSLNLALEIIFRIGDFNKKITMNSYVVLVTILVLFFISFNRYPEGNYLYHKNMKVYNNWRIGYPTYEMESLIREINDYKNVFFSFTDSIPSNPPQSLAISQKMVYNISRLEDINQHFPHLDNNAELMFVINRNNTEKSDDILKKEQYIKENFMFIKERNGYEIYSLQMDIYRLLLYSLYAV